MAENGEDARENDRERTEESNAKKEFGLLRDRLRHHMTPATRAHLQGSFTEQWLEETVPVETPRGPLSFVILGKTSAGRAATLLTKQPATIEWIDAFAPDSVFWDIGANIGVYTLYAALRKDIRIVAFEPVAVNYFLLAANCEANEVDGRVDALLLGVGDSRRIGRIEASQFKPAKSFSFSGKRDFPYRAKQAALILSMDQLVEDFGLPCPNYIKIDAPGMSEAILTGGERLLRRQELREIHMELNEERQGAPRIAALLDAAGFVASGRHAHGGSSDLTFVRR
jgi:FkbM family methyltransferase